MSKVDFFLIGNEIDNKINRKYSLMNEKYSSMIKTSILSKKSLRKMESIFNEYYFFESNFSSRNRKFIFVFTFDSQIIDS
jgi:hypothetical protein